MEREKVYYLVAFSYLVFASILSNIAVRITDQDLVLSRWSLNKDEVVLPLHIHTDSPTQVVLKSAFHHPGGKAYLVIPHFHVQAIEVFLNGGEIFHLGFDDGFHNFDGISIRIPVNLREGENELILTLGAVADLHIDWMPYITEKPDYRVPLSNFLFSFVNMVAIGGLLLAFMYSMVMFLIRRRMYYFFFGLSFLFVALYVINYVFTAIPVSAEVYVIRTKLLIAPVYLFSPLLAAAFDLIVEGKIKKRTIFLIILAIIISLGVFVNSPYRYVEKTAVYFAIVALYGTYQAFKGMLWEFKLGSSVILFSVLQHFLYVLHVSPFPSIMGHGVLVALLIFIVFLNTEFSTVEKELMRTKRELFLDPLTGAFNRRVLDILNVSESDSVVFFDIDNFKKLNDEKGHDYGDFILKRFVSTVQENVRKGDILVRYGGDEFVLVLKDCDEKKAEELARRIDESMNRIYGVKTSYGVTRIVRNLTDAIRVADQFMYKLKKSRK